MIRIQYISELAWPVVVFGSAAIGAVIGIVVSIVSSLVTTGVW